MDNLFVETLHSRNVALDHIFETSDRGGNVSTGNVSRPVRHGHSGFGKSSGAGHAFGIAKNRGSLYRNVGWLATIISERWIVVTTRDVAACNDSTTIYDSSDQGLETSHPIVKMWTTGTQALKTYRFCDERTCC